jgi:cardiolipin synthase
MFCTLIEQAQDELTLSTPYFVPDVPVLHALKSAARRGVRVSLILPRRNDSRIVQAAARGNYRGLLQAGVAIFEHGPGLLHAKTLTIDGDLSFIGSTNLDMRSFDLNFENDLLLRDAALTQAIRARQGAYIAQSERVALDAVRAWSPLRRAWNNLLATLGPVL